ncbi:hypothetical protein IC575_004034 [Cucumis melo]
MRSLKNEVSQLTMQSYSEKRMLGVVDLFRGPVVDAHVSLCGTFVLFCTFIYAFIT